MLCFVYFINEKMMKFEEISCCCPFNLWNHVKEMYILRNFLEKMLSLYRVRIGEKVKMEGLGCT